MKKQLKFWVFIMLLVLIAPVLSSCTTSQYKTYTLKHYGISFSFEYPSGYKKVSAYLQDNPGAPIAVRFAQAHGFLGLLSTDPRFVVNIESPFSVTKTDPITAANTAGSHSLGQELERASITIDGMLGELVAYSSTDPESGATITREVFFSVNGVLWNIFIYSSPEKADKAKTDFEHIISTFKVLP